MSCFEGPSQLMIALEVVSYQRSIACYKPMSRGKTVCFCSWPSKLAKSIEVNIVCLTLNLSHAGGKHKASNGRHRLRLGGQVLFCHFRKIEVGKTSSKIICTHVANLGFLRLCTDLGPKNKNIQLNPPGLCEANTL